MHERPSTAESLIERFIGGSRWLLVPFHVGLLVMVVVLLAKFVQTLLFTLTQTFTLDVKQVIVASLSLIELSLIANLLLLVVFNSYEGFVSRLEGNGDPEKRLDWRGQVGFGLLKLKIMASVTAIAGVYLLEKVVGADDRPGGNIAWAAGVFALFVAASLVLGLVERLTKRDP